MGQQEYWLEMYEKEHQKYEKKFLEKFKEIRNYDKNDFSDEAIQYRVGLKFHKQAALNMIKKGMLDKNLDCGFLLEMVLEIEDRNVRKWRTVDCGVPFEGVRKDEAKSKSVEVDEAERKIEKDIKIAIKPEVKSLRINEVIKNTDQNPIKTKDPIESKVKSKIENDTEIKIEPKVEREIEKVNDIEIEPRNEHENEITKSLKSDYQMCILEIGKDSKIDNEPNSKVKSKKEENLRQDDFESNGNTNENQKQDDCCLEEIKESSNMKKETEKCSSERIEQIMIAKKFPSQKLRSGGTVDPVNVKKTKWINIKKTKWKYDTKKWKTKYALRSEDMKGKNANFCMKIEKEMIGSEKKLDQGLFHYHVAKYSFQVWLIVKYLFQVWLIFTEKNETGR